MDLRQSPGRTLGDPYWILGLQGTTELPLSQKKSKKTSALLMCFSPYLAICCQGNKGLMQNLLGVVGLANGNTIF